MGIPKELNRIIQKHLHAHAAWLPITNTYELGDYGLIADGVFQKMGNIGKEFRVEYQLSTGPDALIDFVSANGGPPAVDPADRQLCRAGAEHGSVAQGAARG